MHLLILFFFLIYLAFRKNYWNWKVVLRLVFSVFPNCLVPKRPVFIFFCLPTIYLTNENVLKTTQYFKRD